MRSLTAHRALRLALVLLALALLPPAVAPAPAGAPPPIAIAVLDLEAESIWLRATTKQMTELLISTLSTRPGVLLVERQRLGEVLSEIELGLSGTIRPDTAALIGRLVGARALVTGRVFASGDSLVAVVRTIGTDTGRVYADAVTLPASEPAGRFAELLAERVAAQLQERRAGLVAPAAPAVDLVQKLAPLTAGKALPTVSVSIPERHAGRPAFDPAAETEIARVLVGLGFPLLDPHGRVRPEIQVTGAALSEVGWRRGNLVSASGRVEVKAVLRATDRVLAADRQTEVAVDLSGEIAGKKALQEASAAVSERLVRALLAAR